MPVEPRPLIRPDVLQPLLDTFALPQHVDSLRQKLTNWADLIASGKIDNFKETALLPDFLTDFFCGLLGYRRPVDSAESYTLSTERHIEVAGEYADAVIGRFKDSSPESYLIAIEGKGPKDPLDRPYAGRRKSAVEQAYGYAINLPCDWLIVTSLRETRLYSKFTDTQTYERFVTTSLATDDRHLSKFLFVLGSERVAPESGGPCHLYALLQASERAGRELTQQYYLQYADIRHDVFRRLSNANPDVPQTDLLAAAQKLLDRVLFVAFSEDRQLLPPDSLKHAHDYRDPYHPRPAWENYRALFRSINEGNPHLEIPLYNGGLFAEDDLLERLIVPDEVCRHFRTLGEYDYRPPSEVASQGSATSEKGLIDVDILGHIFEQSISDLENLKAKIEGRTEDQAPNRRTRRRREGAFYTPAFITKYIVAQTLGAALRERFERIRLIQEARATGTAKRILADPSVYDLDTINRPQRRALIAFWESWQEQLSEFSVLDPACGSGAFLIEAFDQLYEAYDSSNQRLEELRGHRTLFDLDRMILRDNLYGVDINHEAIDICRLSLWIKTAARGKVLTSLDHTIRTGNSIISDHKVDRRAFDWTSAFPEVLKAGGFDAIVGNPPYVRQEMLSGFKDHLSSQYASFHSVADLYVYFYELGTRLLRPGGRLSMIVTNKWLRSGYGEPLRRFLSLNAWIESLVDLGHAKQVFPDADVFPCILVAQKPHEGPAPTSTRVCSIDREQLRVDDLAQQVEATGFEVPRNRFGGEPWNLEREGVAELMRKLMDSGTPLAEYAGAPPQTGIKTGLNEVFLISSAERDRLITEDYHSAEVIQPYVRGADIGRWRLHQTSMWMLTLKSSGDFTWPWTRKGDRAEEVFADTYPAVYQHMKPHEAALQRRSDKGKHWWELRSCSYWQSFKMPKLYFQLIQYHPQYALDDEGHLGNNKTAFIPVADLYLLAVLNSPLMWWFNWRHLQHMKDEALAPNPTDMASVPVAAPSDAVRQQAESAVSRLLSINFEVSQVKQTVLDWLAVEHEIARPSKALCASLLCDSDAFVAAAKKSRPARRPLSSAALKSLRGEHARSLEPCRGLEREARSIEHHVSALINEAYRLDAEELSLIWNSAPPRMPISSSA